MLNLNRTPVSRPLDGTFVRTTQTPIRLCRSARWRSNRLHNILVTFLLTAIGFSHAQAVAQTNVPSSQYNPYGFDAVHTIAEITHPHPDLVLVGSHRGLHALVNGEYYQVPENSLEAIGLAAQKGMEQIELDIKLSSDGVPIMSHDQSLGRETNAGEGGTYFDPFSYPPNSSEAYINDIGRPGNPDPQLSHNPVIANLPSASAQQLLLRTTVPPTVPKTGAETVSTLQQVLDYLTANKIQMVLALDLRDAPTAKAAYSVLDATTDSQGRSYVADALFKIPAVEFLNTNPGTGLHAINLSLVASVFGGPNVGLGNFQPVFNTGDAGINGFNQTGDAYSNTFGSEAKLEAAFNAFQQLADQDLFRIPAVEIQYKQDGGNLTDFVAFAKRTKTLTIFSPFTDHEPTAQVPGQFYTTFGYCCVNLPTFFSPGDTADNRPNIDFLTEPAHPFETITRDDAEDFRILLAQRNLRNLSYLTNDGRTRFPPSLGAPQTCKALGSPECDSNDQTTYTLCASDGGTCTFTGDRNVAYGANGNYVYQTVTNTIACVPSNFQNPPSGSNNSCYFSPPIGYGRPLLYNSTPSNGVIYCADEVEYCPYITRGPALIAANGKYSYTLFNLIGYQCDVNATFYYNGDSAPKSRKACFYSIPQFYLFKHYGPAGYQFCASENGICEFKGLGRVAYGRNGSFAYGVSNGSFSCDSVTVGSDPSPGYTRDCFYQVTTAVSGATGTEVGTPPNTGTGNSVCDIYTSGGTPCVAAHSTVRALLDGYGGSLYQVKRASDGTTSDIGLLSSGYANAAAQDSFCAGTTCTITMIYDQTSYHNDLAIEGPGGTVKTADSGAVANALPITIHGNKVYGVNVTSGVGYRNNATSGVARNVDNNKIAAPEGMYMVTSGTHVNSRCCFDYGNAETSSNDTGNGHMDAINFGTACAEFPPCTGSGPWVEADLENGQYMGNGSNLGDQPISSDFVTAMLKNDSQTTFALKAGDAQSGVLRTEYSGTLPTNRPGYKPMSLEGAIVLGTGGDNSNAGVGSFFEGAMTSGYPSDATEDAVQANIVAAGYTGNSGNGGSTGGGGVYTGPSDPGGPGPQDGFASPASEQPNVLMGSKPALASFNGSLFVAFQADDAGHTLHVASSSDGQNFPPAPQTPNVLIGSAPAMAKFGNQLYIAFQSNDPRHWLFVTSSLSGTNFPDATGFPDILIGGAPAMAEFNDQLYIAFQADDAGHTLHVTSSSDGRTWPVARQIPNVKIGSAPAMAVFNGKLYVAFRADDPSNNVFIASSSDGVHFSSQLLSGQHMGGSSTPALVVSNNVLYYIYGADDTSNEMLVTASTDGSTWQGPKAYLDVKMGAEGPSATTFHDGISVGFQSNDSRNVLFVTHKATEADVYTGPSDPGGPGPQDGFASPAIEQPKDVMGTKPALAFFNGSFFMAFQSNDLRHQLFVTSSSSLTNFPTATGYGNISTGSAPAMAEFNNQLYIAFQSNDARHQLFVTSSPSGTNFPTATGYGNISIGGAPAMAEFNNQLYIAFQADDAGHTLHVTSSSDGRSWPAAPEIANVKIGSAPAMAVFNGKLYVAFRADDTSNNVFIASSSDGIHFSSQLLSGQTMGGSSSPALVVSNNTLYYIYGANDFSNEMLVTASTDGSTWQGPKAYLDVKLGATGPAATAFETGTGVIQITGVEVGFQSNDSRQVLFVTVGVPVP